jgi:hypothetical protein
MRNDGVAAQRIRSVFQVLNRPPEYPLTMNAISPYRAMHAIERATPIVIGSNQDWRTILMRSLLGNICVSS